MTIMNKVTVHRIVCTLLAAVTLLVSNPLTAKADIYPGDTSYSQIIQTIYHGVTSDQIQMAWKSDIQTRPQLCQDLVNRYNNTSPTSRRTNATFIGVSLTVQDCLNALYYTSGYASAAGLQAWAGDHEGTWFSQDGSTFPDAAIWENPVGEVTNNPGGDLDQSGNPRIYDFQKVVFTERSGNARYGWNQSHPDVAYIWGWDPKDSSDDNGYTGTNVGFTFSKGSAECIVWVSPKEAFLECAANGRRTSNSFWGWGQWSIN